MLDMTALAEATALIVREHVAAQTAPLIARIAELEARDAGAVAEFRDRLDALTRDLPTTIVQSTRLAIEEQAAAAPPPCAGKDADPAVIRAMVDEAVAALPPAKDGVSVTVDDVTPLIKAAVDMAVAAVPVARDGVGVAGAVIDRAGNLTLTLTDGTMRELGGVVGRDADREELREWIKSEVEAIPHPKDGKDAFGLDDFDIEPSPDGRTLKFKFARGDELHTYELAFPVMIYRGVWREGEAYQFGDTVTWGGSLWHADKATSGKPDAGDWTLAAKRGRDGKDKI